LSVISSPTDVEHGAEVTATKVVDGGAIMGALLSSAGSHDVSKQCNLEFAATTAQYFGEALQDQSQQLEGCTNNEAPSFAMVRSTKPVMLMVEKQQRQMLNSLGAAQERVRALKSSIPENPAFELQGKETFQVELQPVEKHVLASVDSLRKALDYLSPSTGVYRLLDDGKGGLLVKSSQSWECSTDSAQTAEFTSQFYQCSSMISYMGRSMNIASDECNREFRAWNAREASQVMLKFAASLGKCNALDGQVHFTKDPNSQMYKDELVLKEQVVGILTGDNPLRAAMVVAANNGMSVALVSLR
jgi:hypothetical protein